MAAVAVAAAAVLVVAISRGPTRREPAEPARTSAGWHPRAATIPDGGCAPAAAPPPVDAGGLTRFAAIGDYGYAGPAEEAVADLVKAFRPDFVVTMGDNNYPLGAADTIDLNVGLFYHDFIAPYVGRFGCGAARNRFFPTLGNHDWYAPEARPYLDYFALPGNERYYDVTWGSVQVFALDSDPSEPDGNTADSRPGRLAQARARGARRRAGRSSPCTTRLTRRGRTARRSRCAGRTRRGARTSCSPATTTTTNAWTSTACPTSSTAWAGPRSTRSAATVPGSVARFNESAGALFVEADATSLHARFQSVDGRQVDALSLAKP